MSTQSRPTLEFLSYLATEELKKDKNLTHDTLELIRDCKGLKRIYEGTGIEEPDRRWIIIVWETYEDHKRLMDDKELYPKVNETLGRCLGGEVEMRHFVFNDDTQVAFAAPVTEIAELKLKPETNKTEFEDHMRYFVHHARTAPLADEHVPFVFGEMREKPGTYFFVGGWTTKQHHLDSIKDPGSTKEQVEKIGDYTTYKVHHLKVEEYNLRRDEQKL